MQCIVSLFSMQSCTRPSLLAIHASLSSLLFVAASVCLSCIQTYGACARAHACLHLCNVYTYRCVNFMYLVSWCACAKEEVWCNDVDRCATC
mmetsp:Transcript_61471/g.90182  ORF Transcript_61471/g.90182 Transcript_61471/m.90182 type:complete len:92 (-) Transcript_61471:480-755(-)